MHELNLNEARKKRSSKDLSKQEIKEILDYLKAHPEDEGAFPYLMKKYNVSQTTIGILIIKDEQAAEGM